MKFRFLLLITLILFGIPSLAQENREVLVEVFTNSHCPLCPTAHNRIDDYLAGPNGDKINYIFYHMVYPYSDDSLYHQSKMDSDARDNYYNPISATPQGFFDGRLQGSSSNWNDTLNVLVNTTSPLKIELSGTKSSGSLDIKVTLTRTGNINETDLVLHFVLVENVFYAGRNGITLHKQVMRKMFPDASGKPFTINMNETKDIDQTINLIPLWNPDSLKVVVFTQSTSTKKVYQSETISYSDLNITSVNDDNVFPDEFVLEQNYPNPFNPSTKIKFKIPSVIASETKQSLVSLIVYNLLGNEVATLVNEYKPAGSYEVEFNASELASGVYFYKLQTGSFVKTKKMVLLK